MYSTTGESSSYCMAGYRLMWASKPVILSRIWLRKPLTTLMLRSITAMDKAVEMTATFKAGDRREPMPDRARRRAINSSVFKIWS